MCASEGGDVHVQRCVQAWMQHVSARMARRCMGAQEQCECECVSVSEYESVRV